LQEAVARRYNVLPFDKELIKMMGNAFQRAFLIASLDIDTDLDLIMKMIDYSNMSNLAAHRVKNPKSMLDKKAGSSQDVYIRKTLPDGKRVKVKRTLF
jgi:hypothetical protein